MTSVGHRSRARKNPAVPTIVVLAICGLTIVLPLYIVVVTALKSPGEIVAGSGIEIPLAAHWNNFVQAWNATNFPRAFLNTAIISVGTVVVIVLATSAFSYALARNAHRWEFKLFSVVVLAALFVPFPIVMLPLVKQTAALGIDNQVGLILLYFVFNLPFNTLLYTSFLRSLPPEIEQAAQLDGAGTWRVFWTIVFPLLAPMNATVGILMFLHSWNDFMLPLVLLTDPTLSTLPLAQSIFSSTTNTSYGPAFASYLMSVLPVLVVYLVSQRWVLSGVMRGAIQ